MEDNSTKTMVFGIIAIALCETGIGGIIFGAIALSEAKKYAAAHDGVVSGKAKVGKILGTVGLIVDRIGLRIFIPAAVSGLLML